jgi:hypothetical protein
LYFLVSNIQKDSVKNGKELFLVPKCECKPNYEGDFCENYSLDECDQEDLKNHRDYLETTKEQIDKIQKALGNESFFQTLKSILYGEWNPPKEYNTNELEKARGFEAGLREKGKNLNTNKFLDFSDFRNENFLRSEWILQAI